MKRLLLLLLLGCAPIYAQNSRYDYQATTTQGSGTLLPVVAMPGATIAFYTCAGTSAASCNTLASTYNTATATTPCPTYAQVVLQGTASCVSTADGQGNFGAWFQSSGTYGYGYTITYNGTTYGPYQFTVGGGGGGGTYVQAGTGISVTGSGTQLSPYIISTSTALVINSFTGCSGTVELGASIVNPTFSASYSTTPTSAYITNTDNINSPFNLTTPFTSGTVTGTFSHTSIATTTFTLTAIGSTTQTRTCTDSWQPAIFGGIGTAGATATVTASGTTAVLSNGAALSRIQLGTETVGQTLGSYSPTAQNVYLLLIGGSHTFTDACTGFPFAFNTPTAVSFTNVNGDLVNMWLYQSTNPLYVGSCAYTPKVAS